MRFSTTLVMLLLSGLRPGLSSAQPARSVVVDDFSRPDSLYHGHGWETLNPGYWKIENGALRRRLRNRGDWGSKQEFPFRRLLHGKTPAKSWQTLPASYPPSLPFGMIWRRDWQLTGNYIIRIEAKVRALPPAAVEETEKSAKYMPGYSLMGIGFGSESLLESWTGKANFEDAAWMALWRGNGLFGIYSHATDKPGTVAKGSEKRSALLKAGDVVRIEVAVSGDDSERATVTAIFSNDDIRTMVTCQDVDRGKFTEGYFGLVGRGLLDFEVNRIELVAFDNQPIAAPINDLRICYALGDTLREDDAGWQCKFIAMFRSDGKRVEIRISDSEEPPNGWAAVKVAGSAPIVSNHFRLNTASIDVRLPHNPAEKTMYYTVWKDGEDVTADPRTGFLGKKDYVGRLPQLRAPYRICGLGGHSITGGADMSGTSKFQKNWVRGQPTPLAFEFMEDYGFQILNWEDDVWYLELVLAPTSIDDAYKIINLTIANPTTRWQMMRHWNTINPGDHDFGMNDLRGPEQYIIRHHSNLGQDPEYLRRNYRIVLHLISGDENPSGTKNTKYWRRWKMPDGDFSFLILDARSWRDSTDTALYVNYGWGHDEDLYDRTAPMRVLLGEEQFAWLHEVVRTDTSSLICITGLNGLHTIWQGSDSFDVDTGLNFDQRGRGSGDFAGWVKAGSDRVIELLGSRQGIVSVYGDVHAASIMKNQKHRFFECSFGALARTGGRSVKRGFGRKMADFDLRPLEMIALHHPKYASPDLEKREGTIGWNFLEMNFDTRGPDPSFSLKIRTLLDPPNETPRGGGFAREHASNTGRPLTCKLPSIETLPDADVRFSSTSGQPIVGIRSLEDGTVPLEGLIEIDGEDIQPGARVLMTVFDGNKIDSRIIQTLPVDQKPLTRFRNHIEELERQAKEEFDGWVKEHRAGLEKKTSGR